MDAQPEALAGEHQIPHRTINKGGRTTEWDVCRQPGRGRRVRCGRCPDFIPDGGYKCRPSSQREARLWVHPECLPGSPDDLVLHAGAGVEQAEVDALWAHLTAEPTTDLADMTAPILPMVPRDTGTAGGSSEATGWSWWGYRPWLPEDVTPEHTAMQVPRRLGGAYVEVKMMLMKAVLEAPEREADHRC